MLSLNNIGVEYKGICNSQSAASTQLIFATALAKPLYSNFVFDRDATFCLEECHDMRLQPNNLQ